MIHPVTGRFISADNLVPDWHDPQALDRYAYARNNPVKYVDPDGHFFLSPFSNGRLVGPNAIFNDRTPINIEGIHRDRETVALIGEGGLEEGIDLVDTVSTISSLGVAGFASIGGKRIANELIKNTAKKIVKNNGLTKAQIKAARQRGVNRAKSVERKLLKSGHPGTVDENFSWKERKQIVESGQFPEDIRWHHINDVKRNPELADIPDNVIPSRGGTSGHLKKYHPDGTQAGSSGDLLDRDHLGE